MFNEFPRTGFTFAKMPDKLIEGSYELTLYPNGLQIHYWQRDCPSPRSFPITYRSLTEYEKRGVISLKLLNDIVDRDLQVVEPGAGLAQLVPALACLQAKPPIVIDPLDYVAVDSLLEQALERDISKENRSLIQTLLRGITVYTNPRLVRLYNMTLEDAYQQHPELEGIADVVIDVSGARLWAARPKEAHQLEVDWLLKKAPQGRYFYAAG